jgi:hypothetical protein
MHGAIPQFPQCLHCVVVTYFVCQKWKGKVVFEPQFLGKFCLVTVLVHKLNCEGSVCVIVMSFPSECHVVASTFVL